MAKTCTTCGTPNEAAAIFCDNCGAQLGAAPAPLYPTLAPASATPAPPPYSPPPAPAAPPYSPPPASAPAPFSPPTPAGNMICPACGHPALMGEMFCDNCGASLSGIGAPSMGTPAPFQPSPPPTYQPPAMQPPPAQPMAPPYQPPYQPPYPPPAMPQQGGRLLIGAAQIPLPPKTQVTIGRPDPHAQPPWIPDIDLSPYGGGDPTSGVSRRHAKMVWQGAWYVEDLGSVNGVFVRGQRIFQRTPLNNGDQIGLGRLLLTFYAS